LLAKLHKILEFPNNMPLIAQKSDFLHSDMLLKIGVKISTRAKFHIFSNIFGGGKIFSKKVAKKFAQFGKGL